VTEDCFNPPPVDEDAELAFEFLGEVAVLDLSGEAGVFPPIPNILFINDILFIVDCD